WPQSAFREWQTGFNPVETLLTPLPDLYWWSQDISVTDLALARGREWSPVEIDFGAQGLPDPIIAVGRRNELVFYHPNLPQGLTADDPAYVQAVSVTSSGASFTATPLGRLKIQQPRSGGAALETRVTGMTYADIGDSANPLPFLFLTTADGQVICVDTRPFQNTT